MKRSLFVFVTVLPLRQYLALDNGVGVRPAMGINTWNSLRCNGISVSSISGIADRVIELGLRDVGYEYINIDDCWCSKRSTVTSELVADPVAFPNGIKPLADYIHSKGLRFGIYGDRGTKTCALRPGSEGYEERDAKTYAEWGVDYLKQDSCFASTEPEEALREYATMRDALNKTGRPILFSLCGWNAWYAPPNSKWGAGYGGGKTLGNSWRISSDSDDWPHIYAAVQINAHLAKYASAGGFNDPDMLIGSQSNAAISLTPRQSRAQFSLWAIMAAPLLLGNNVLSNVSMYDMRTYTNEAVISVNQDLGVPAHGVQGELVSSNCPEWKWVEENNFSPYFYPIAVANEAAGIATIIVCVSGALCIMSARCVGWRVCRCRPENAGGYTQFSDEDKIEKRDRSDGSRCAGIARVMFWVYFLVACACMMFAIWVESNRFVVEPCQQIFAKTLSSSSGGVQDVAVVFVNWAPIQSEMICGHTCMELLGFPTGAMVQDLWTNNDARLQVNLTELVPEDGGYRMYLLTHADKR